MEGALAQRVAVLEAALAQQLAGSPEEDRPSPLRAAPGDEQEPRHAARRPFVRKTVLGQIADSAVVGLDAPPRRRSPDRPRHASPELRADWSGAAAGDAFAWRGAGAAGAGVDAGEIAHEDVE